MKNFLVLMALSLGAQNLFAKEILLSPASSTIVDRAKVTIGCEGDENADSYCRGDLGHAELISDEKDVDGNAVERLVNQFDSIAKCLNTIAQKPSSTVELALTPKSSATLQDTLISVSCSDNQKAKFSCKEKFGRTILFKLTAVTAGGARQTEFVKSYDSLEECLDFVRSDESEASLIKN